MLPELKPGSLLIERYEIGRTLGRGSFGVVYLCRDRQCPSPNDPRVAIKQQSMQAIIDFERQADVRGALIHPAIPRVHDYFMTEDSAYLVMDFIDGLDLEAVLNRDRRAATERPSEQRPSEPPRPPEPLRPLPEKLVLDWAIQLCDFLNYLHTHPVFPIIFRDIKPNNIMVDKKGQIRVPDFGLARIYPPRFFIDKQEAFAYLYRGLPIGTEGYSPPEQYDGFVQPQSDIYALGATLHHLLTHRDPRQHPPFTFSEHPVRTINPAVSIGMEKIIMRAVEVDVHKRFATAKEMMAALQALN